MPSVRNGNERSKINYSFPEFRATFKFQVGKLFPVFGICFFDSKFMRRIIKSIVNKTWKPYVEWYLRAPRNFTYKNNFVEIVPGVFHPGFFFSTKLLISFLEKQNLDGKKFLEMGCGSGLVSIVTAKQNAKVTAADISHEAIVCTKNNAAKNNAQISVIESNLFKSIPPQQFDIIAVNPPYYKKKPVSPDQFAWYCGENLEYFNDFFQQARLFVSDSSRIIMVLSDECDMEGIRSIALKNGWIWEMVLKKKTAWEYGYIFNICIAKDEMK
jgi:release factor glutamine methyltransferase